MHAPRRSHRVPDADADADADADTPEVRTEKTTQTELGNEAVSGTLALLAMLSFAFTCARSFSNAFAVLLTLLSRLSWT